MVKAANDGGEFPPYRKVPQYVEPLEGEDVEVKQFPENFDYYSSPASYENLSDVRCLSLG
jgi:hypothetical protein